MHVKFKFFGYVMDCVLRFTFVIVISIMVCTKI